MVGRDLEYFSQAGFDMDRISIKRNAPIAQLYEDAIRNEGAIISSSGALINFSGKKTGRSPKDKRIVYEETSKDEIWWGSVNIMMDERELRYPMRSLVLAQSSLQILLKSTASVQLTTSTPVTTFTSSMDSLVCVPYVSTDNTKSAERAHDFTNSGIRSTALKSGSSARVHIMLSSW